MFLCNFVLLDVFNVFPTTFDVVFQQTQTAFCCQTVFDTFRCCMIFLEKFVEKFLDRNGGERVLVMSVSKFTFNSLS